MYRKSLKDTKENLEGIDSIPEAVRQMFSVALLYESDPNDSNFRAMHQRVLLMNAAVTSQNRTLYRRPSAHAFLFRNAGCAHRSHHAARPHTSSSRPPRLMQPPTRMGDYVWLVQRLSLSRSPLTRRPLSLPGREAATR